MAESQSNAGRPNGVPPNIVAILTVLLAFTCIVAFAGMFSWGIYRVWAKQPAPDNEGFVNVATALAALVGGIVAVGFNQPTKAAPTARIVSRFVALGRLCFTWDRRDSDMGCWTCNSDAAAD
jgi:hypothetical protein